MEKSRKAIEILCYDIHYLGVCLDPSAQGLCSDRMLRTVTSSWLPLHAVVDSPVVFILFPPVNNVT